jgi:hypothetical protein
MSQAQSRGTHAMGMLSLDLEPGRGWFAGADFGYVISGRYDDSASGVQPLLRVNGPLLRLTVGLR